MLREGVSSAGNMTPSGGTGEVKGGGDMAGSLQDVGSFDVQPKESGLDSSAPRDSMGGFQAGIWFYGKQSHKYTLTERCCHCSKIYKAKMEVSPTPPPPGSPVIYVISFLFSYRYRYTSQASKSVCLSLIHTLPLSVQYHIPARGGLCL